jgi:phosphoglycolate phosphatase-like HAD superfamily hydrolase
MTLAEERAIESKIRDIVETVQRQNPDIVRARFQFEEDWTGQPALYIRITLRDAATRPSRLAAVTSAIREELRSALRNSEIEGTPSVRFRSQSETLDMPDPKWA